MKTAEEILRSYGQLPNSGGEEVVPLNLAQKAMKTYAEQAIDECAEKCYQKYITIAGKSELKIIADKNDILKVKSELK